MALLTSGEIALAGSTVGRSVAIELGRGATDQTSLGEAFVRNMASRPDGQISLSNLYGTSYVTGTPSTQTFVYEYTSAQSGTFTVPANTVSIEVEIVGAGAGGTGGAAFSNRAPVFTYTGGGGGAGGFFNGSYSANPGDTINWTVGGGGTGGKGSTTASGSYPATNGGNSTFGTITVNGGQAGTNPNTGSSTPGTGGSGGNGSTSNGGNGGNGGIGGDGITGGNGGTSYYGVGGIGPAATGSAFQQGNPGVNPGSGGAGAPSKVYAIGPSPIFMATDGGAGADGKLKITVLISNAFNLTKTISSNTQNYNLYNDLIANGWDGSQLVDATVTVDTGVYVWTDSTSTAAFDVGILPSGSIVNIINKGYIMGKGGNGGGTNISWPIQATNGGPAMSINYPVTIDNTYTSAYIGGGGGGGGRSDASSQATNGGGGGAGGGEGGWVKYSDGSANSPGGAGGSIGQSGSNGSIGTAIATNSGGGGGRVFPGVGAAAVGSTAGQKVMLAGLGGTGGGSGGFGKLANGGSGYSGAGGSAGNPGGNASPANAVLAGGGGGGWGASGGSGSINAAGTLGPGGAGGKAVNTNGNAVTWVSGNTTRVYGAVA